MPKEEGEGERMKKHVCSMLQNNGSNNTNHPHNNSGFFFDEVAFQNSTGSFVSPLTKSPKGVSREQRRGFSKILMIPMEDLLELEEEFNL